MGATEEGEHRKAVEVVGPEQARVAGRRRRKEARQVAELDLCGGVSQCVGGAARLQTKLGELRGDNALGEVWLVSGFLR